MAKASHLAEPAMSAVKWFATNPRNRSRGVLDYDPLILLNDSHTGHPIAILSARWITGIRTAALSSIAAQHLARPDAESIGFVGCGNHLEVLRSLFPLRRVKAFSRSSASAQAFCDEVRRAGLTADPVGSARDAITDVDVVVTSVPPGSPLDPPLRGEWARSNAFVAMVDRGFSWDPSSLDAFSLALTDDVQLSGPGAPERIVWSEGLSSDLSDLLCGRLSQQKGAGRTALAFSGTALADVATAALVYGRAVTRGLGHQLPR
jgi:ornithine cyclodeaminase/alanine dehydrogenase